MIGSEDEQIVLGKQLAHGIEIHFASFNVKKGRIQGLCIAILRFRGGPICFLYGLKGFGVVFQILYF